MSQYPRARIERRQQMLLTFKNAQGGFSGFKTHKETKDWFVQNYLFENPSASLKSVRLLPTFDLVEVFA